MRDLKHLIYFEDLLQEAYNPLVRQAKEEGKLALGYTCYFMPEVLLDLPGCFSVRLRAPRCSSPDMATYYMSNRTCHYGRALFERALEGGFNFLDAQLATETCTVTCRFQEHLERMPDVINNMGFKVSFTDVPFKKNENSIDHYEKQLKAHVLDFLHDEYGVDTSDEALLKAIEEVNEVSRIIREIGDFRKLDQPTITGYEFAVINLVSMTCPKYLIIDKLRETLEELKTRAVNKAVRDAAEATFRDNNELSTFVSRFLRDPSTPRWARLIGEGIVPFRKTPANIGVRIYEYSPLSIIGNTVKAIQAERGKAGKTSFARTDVTANDIIEQWAKTFTGTGLVALGYALAAMGKLVGREPDKDKERTLFEQQGLQKYSFVGDNITYTLDWLAPGAIPMFLGANIEQAVAEGGFSLKDGMDVILHIMDPMIEMSMLQGINDALENAATYTQEGAVFSFVVNAMWSYMTQGMTNTLVGQLERGAEETRMQTYVDKNEDAVLPNTLQRMVGKTSAKIPGWDYNQIPYIDAWGDPQESNSKTWNTILQLFSPGYVSERKQNETLTEIERLYDATDDASVILNTAAKQYQQEGETKYLTPEEYINYAVTRGQAAKEAVAGLIDSKTYQDLSDEDKVKVIKAAYEYANQVGKAEVGEYEPEKWVQNAQEAEAKYGIHKEQFILMRYLAGQISGVKDWEGETISNSSGLKKMEMLYGQTGLTDQQRQAMAEYLDIGKSVRGLTRQEVKDAIAALPTEAEIRAQQKQIADMTATLQNSPLWAQATPAQQEKALQNIQDIVFPKTRVMFTNPGETLQEKVEAGADTGLNETDYVLYKLALQINDKPTESGNLGSYTNAEVEAAIRAVPGLTDAERAYLWIAQGKSEKSMPRW